MERNAGQNGKKEKTFGDKIADEKGWNRFGVASGITVETDQVETDAIIGHEEQKES